MSTSPAELFATDYAPDGRRYVAAALPTLPFGDGWFRLTLSSHLLFVYPDQLDFRNYQLGNIYADSNAYANTNSNSNTNADSNAHTDASCSA